MAVQSHVEEKIGQALVRRDVMKQEEVDAVIKLQKAGDPRLFGEIAIDLEFLDVRDLIDYLRSN
jgi:hypothetical protein